MIHLDCSDLVIIGVLLFTQTTMHDRNITVFIYILQTYDNASQNESLKNSIGYKPGATHVFITNSFDLFQPTRKI